MPSAYPRAAAAATIIMLCLAVPIANAQRYVEREYRFGALGIENGLSQGMIFCMVQDSRGFIWFGTKEGLNRYDGYSFRVYRNIPGDSTSLADNHVFSISADAHGRLWIGTRTKGLLMFDPVSESFTPLFHPGASPDASLDDPVHQLVLDQHGRLWIGGRRKLLASIDTRPVALSELRRSCKSYRKDARFESLNSFFMSRSSYGELVMMGDEGLWMSLGASSGFKRLLKWRQLGIPVGEQGYEIVTGTMDRNDVFWLSIVMNGKFALLKINPMERRVLDTLRFRYKDADLVTRHMFVGPDNVLYCSGSYYFVRYDQRSDTYTVTPPEPDHAAGLSGSVSDLLWDRSGNLWIGTAGHGANTFNPRTLLFHADATPLKRHLFRRDLALFEQYLKGKFTREKQLMPEVFPVRADDGSVWCGTANYGLLHYDKKTRAIRQYGVNAYDPNSFLMVRLSVPFIDSRKRVWIGNTQGVAMVVDGPEQWKHYFFDKDGPDLGRREDNITCYFEDADGTMWLGTLSSGLARFDPSTGTFRLFGYSLADASSISADNVLSIAADPLLPDRYLWIGTDGGGLNRFDKQTGTFKRLGVSDGLPNMVVYGILPDSFGRLWMSTNNGIACLSPKTLQFMNFTVRDGLQHNEFNRTEYYSIPPRLFFGGVNGHNGFNPADILRNLVVPNIVITGLRLFNKPLSPRSDSSILHAAVPYVKRITLAHDQNMLTFEFAALDFTDPELNRYRYKMDGLDDHWIDAGGNRTATYTYLPPGEYTFRVVGTNNHGVWNLRGAKISITVLPPWWQTYWAYTLYLVILAFVIVLIDRVQRRRVINRERERARMREAMLRAESAEFEARAVRAENERNEQELRLAATVQQHILPRALPDIPGYTLAGINIPAHEIGGDYYDCIAVGDDKYALVIADVTGKGIPASLLVNSLHASLLVYLEFDTPLEELAHRLNAFIYNSSTPSTFITCLIALLHPPSGTVEIINAGHNPAIIARGDGALEVLDTHGLPFGCSVDVTHYKPETQTLQSGDGLLLYTDGITEAMNSTNDPFGNEALEDFLVSECGREPASLISALIERISEHRGGAPRNDDVTMIYLKKHA